MNVVDLNNLKVTYCNYLIFKYSTGRGNSSITQSYRACKSAVKLLIFCTFACSGVSLRAST